MWIPDHLQKFKNFLVPLWPPNRLGCGWCVRRDLTRAASHLFLTQKYGHLKPWSPTVALHRTSQVSFKAAKRLTTGTWTTCSTCCSAGTSTISSTWKWCWRSCWTTFGTCTTFLGSTQSTGLHQSSGHTSYLAIQNLFVTSYSSVIGTGTSKSSWSAMLGVWKVHSTCPLATSPRQSSTCWWEIRSCSTTCASIYQRWRQISWCLPVPLW